MFEMNWRFYLILILCSDRFDAERISSPQKLIIFVLLGSFELKILSNILSLHLTIMTFPRNSELLSHNTDYVSCYSESWLLLELLLEIVRYKLRILTFLNSEFLSQFCVYIAVLSFILILKCYFNSVYISQFWVFNSVYLTILYQFCVLLQFCLYLTILNQFWVYHNCEILSLFWVFI